MSLEKEGVPLLVEYSLCVSECYKYCTLQVKRVKVMNLKCYRSGILKSKFVLYLIFKTLLRETSILVINLHVNIFVYVKHVVHGFGFVIDFMLLETK